MSWEAATAAVIGTNDVPASKEPAVSGPVCTQYHSQTRVTVGDGNFGQVVAQYETKHSTQGINHVRQRNKHCQVRRKGVQAAEYLDGVTRMDGGEKKDGYDDSSCCNCISR